MSAEDFSVTAQHLASDMACTDGKTGSSRFVTPLQKMDLNGFRGDIPGVKGYPWMLNEGLELYHGDRGIETRDVKDWRNPDPRAWRASSYFALQHRLGNACAFVVAQAIADPGSIRTMQEGADFMRNYMNEPFDFSDLSLD